MASLPLDTPDAPPILQRARGRAEVGFRVRDGATRLDRLFQQGQAKIRLPKVHGGEPVTAVLINTGGGIAGGDRIVWGADFGPGTRALVTSQAAERVYRSSPTDGALSGEIDTRLTIAAGASAEWLPQETILFDRARLRRRLHVDMAQDATLLAMEAVLLGRKASGESLTQGLFRDSWRVRRAGRLVFAEETAFEGDLSARLAKAATLKGAAAYATVLLVAPDAAAHLEPAREVLIKEAAEGGISTFDGLCVARLIAQDGAALRRILIALLRALGGELPRVWHN